MARRSTGPTPHRRRAGPKTAEATCWRDVDEWIEDRRWTQDQREPRPSIVYRGSAQTRHLESALLRRGDGYAAREHHVLGAFRRYAYRSGASEWSDWEWLALAQHHGLPTRLLDFTFSPLVAMHFATLTDPDEAGVLWAVDYEKVHEHVPKPLRQVLTQRETRLFVTEQLADCARTLADFDRLAGGRDFAIFWEPPSIDERIVNQGATFCVMSSPTARFDQWLAKHPDAGRALRLTPEARADARKHLDLVGITERLLFPDLTGLARWIARYYE